MRLTLHGGVETGSQAQADPEGKDAELGQDLARLARRSRCFSRGPEAWKAAWKIFLYCFHLPSMAQAAFSELSRSCVSVYQPII